MAEAATTAKALTRKTIQSNLLIQESLATQAAQLTAQLEELDKLIEGVNRSKEVSDVPLEGEFQIPGSKRASGPVPSFELLSQESPFYSEASQRAYYLRWTGVRPIKGKEADVLADSVKKENMRLEAYRARDDPTAPPIDIVNNVQGIDWLIVAEKVSDHSNIKRTPDECRIQWVGNLHPKVNHGIWTQDELEKLHDLTANQYVREGGKINWTRIARDLGTNRIPIDCMKRTMMRPQHNWNSVSDQKLREAVQLFGTNNWNLVARYVSPYATTSQCQTRYVRSVDPGIKRGSWSPEEDDRLRKAVAAFSNSWIDVAGVLPGRTNEQCRERWGEMNVDRSQKGNWSPEEDQMLLDLVKELGKKWKVIGKKIGSGRTGPYCRIRYDKLSRMRTKQAEEEAAAVTSWGSSSQIPPPDTQTIPPGMALREGVTVAELEARQGRAAAVPPPSGGALTTPMQDVSTMVQLSSQAPIREVVSPELRPRLTRKSKKKEKAINSDISGEIVDIPEQLITSTDQLPVPPGIPSLAISNRPLIRPVTQLESQLTTRPEMGECIIVVASPPSSVSRGSGELVQEGANLEANVAGQDKGEQREVRKRKQGDLNDMDILNDRPTVNELSPQKSQRKKQRAATSSGNKGMGDSQVPTTVQQPTEGEDPISSDDAHTNPVENIAVRGRGRGRGSRTVHGRVRGRGRGRGRCSTMAISKRSTPNQEDKGSAGSVQTGPERPESTLVPSIDQNLLPMPT